MATLGITAGCSATMAMMSPPNTIIYAPSGMTVLKMKGEPAPGTLKFQVYTIDFVGPEYWGDRLNTVRNAFQNLQGTAAIAAIWGQYIKTPFSVDSGSSGMIGSNAQSHTENGKKPFTAMYDIMKMLAGGQGNWLLYHDNQSARINQLQTMLSNSMSPGATQQYFIQSETWGALFNNPGIYQTIIVAQLQAGRGDGGYASASQLSKFASQSLSVFDVGLGKIVMNGMNIITSGAVGALSGAGSQYGGRDNRQVTNSAGIANAIAPFTKTVGEGWFSAQVRNGPQLALKVPLQTGLNVTVGKGINASLLPPSTGPIINTGILNLNWMVCDLCHEIYQDDRELNATTNMQMITQPGSY